jgi:hypothetical protein
MCSEKLQHWLTNLNDVEKLKELDRLRSLPYINQDILDRRGLGTISK